MDSFCYSSVCQIMVIFSEQTVLLVINCKLQFVTSGNLMRFAIYRFNIQLIF